MAREVKFGLLLVLGLTSVFGFMVYKRMHQPLGLSAGTEAESSESSTESSETSADPFAEKTEPAVVTAEAVVEPAAQPVLRIGDSQPVAKPTPAAIADDPFADSPKPIAQPVQLKLKADERKSREETPFDPFAAEQVTTRTPVPVKSPATQTKPVIGSLQTESRTPTAEPDDPFTTPALSIPSKNEASAVSTTVIERRPEKFEAKVEAAPLRSTPDLFPGSQLSTRDSRPSGEKYLIQPSDNYWSISKKVYGTGRYFQALQKHNEAVVPDPQRMKPGTEIAIPAVNVLESQYAEWIPDSAMTAKSAIPAGVTSADTYITEAGDNFWIISKKVYGSGRYFQALAEHNRGTIPDPLKLRAGTAVHTPTADILQAQYANLIDGPVVAASGLGNEDRLKPGLQQDVPGFFVDASDQPCYRVGPEDTLTSIAKAHLGRSSRWVQILEMNRSVVKDGNALSVGTVLRLPPDASQVQAVGLERGGR